MLKTSPLVETTRAVAARDPSDGSPAELPVFLARPAGSGGARRPGVLLIQEIFGVNSHIQDVARRLAAAGYVVVAPDIFYRSAPWLTFGYTEFEAARPHAAKLSLDLVTGDMRAALEFLAAQPDVDPCRLGVIGFCFGGRSSLVAAERFGERLRAGVIFYGGGIVSEQPGAPIERVADVRCPVLAFFGALDRHIPREHVERLEQGLTAAGVANEVYYYPEADHGFFCDARASYHPQAAQDAWQRTLRFFEQHLGPVPAVAWT